MSDFISTLEQSVQRLQQYIEKEQYRGYDPYDGLTSAIFKLPLLNSNHKIRFLAQQLVKRSPLNLRPILGINKGLNPVTLGLCIQAYTASPKKSDTDKIPALIQQLKDVIPKGFHGACWGYDFPWEARYATIPAYQPTVVATGFISNALFYYYQKTKNTSAADLVVSAAQFVLQDLNRISDADETFCFSYSPFDREKVFNASMKGARLLAQAYSINHDEILKKTAKNAVAWVMKFQRDDGAWIYSQSEAGKWIDNYHTGYVLDTLSAYIQLTDDHTFEPNLKKGLQFYLNNFFEASGQPKFYDREAYPADCTAAAQSILTLLRFGEHQQALKVAEWMIPNMQDPNGYFYFRKYRNHTDKSSFMRWSNAWMFAGLNTLLYSNENKNPAQ
ncbi:exopolysaccharide biosynthesis protein VpsJ [soil metagenome]